MPGTRNTIRPIVNRVAVDRKQVLLLTPLHHEAWGDPVSLVSGILCASRVRLRPPFRAPKLALNIGDLQGCLRQVACDFSYGAFAA